MENELRKKELKHKKLLLKNSSNYCILKNFIRAKNLNYDLNYDLWNSNLNH